MDQKYIDTMIKTGRDFMKFSQEQESSDFQSDQQLKKPQPPLVKATMTNSRIDLPKDFDNLNMIHDFTRILTERKSSRVYTQTPVTLLQLSYLLWATQGVKEIRGQNYATIRTVPSGGARHPFETYLVIQNVEGLEEGCYHYLPMEHQLEYLHPFEDLNISITQTLVGQAWAEKAAVVFYWSIVPYRCEWRYGIFAHRPALMDIGHVGENLYLACAALELGTCGVAAYDGDSCARVFGLDNEEEFMVYTSPVGCIK